MGNAGDEDPDRSRAIAPAGCEAGSERHHAPVPDVRGAAVTDLQLSRERRRARLLAAVLLFSSIVTLTLTALQLYLDIDREVGVISTRLDEIGRSTTGSLGESLWNLDQNSSSSSSTVSCGWPDIPRGRGP